MPVFDFSHLGSELRDKLVKKLAEELRYCKKCGAKLGIDCGDAEPDFNQEYCSIGCYEESTKT